MRKAALLLVLFPLFTVAQISLPSYPSVLDQFFSHYSYTPAETVDGLNFARMKNGWHVQVIDRVTEEVKTDQVYWTVNEGYFKLTGFDSADSEKAAKLQSFLSAGSLYSWYGYERCRYYGYSHWSEDMIEEFGNGAKDNYTDTLFEGLARAYSAYASKFLWYQYGGQNESGDPFKTKLGPLDRPSRERVDSVAHYIRKSIEIYKELANRNNRYVMLVGNPGMKVFNEQMNAYMHLSMAGYDSLARSFLLSVKPDKTIRDIAHNYLSACAPNAILFTFGDNDTYPLWYVQEKEGYRKDVAVIHTALVGLPAYVEMIKRKQQVAFSTTDSLYGDASFLYFLKEKKEGQEKLSLTRFIKTIHAGKDKVSSDVYGHLRSYPCDTIEIRFDLDRFKKIWNQPNLRPIITIDPHDYMLNDQFMVLDIINTNVYNRPIYFTATYDLLASNLLQTGTVLQFLPLDPLSQTFSTRISIEKTKSYLKQYRIVSSEFSSSDVFITMKDAEVLALYSYVAEYYFENGKKDSAANVMKDLMERYHNRLPVLVNESNVAELLLATGNLKEGTRLLEECSELFYRLYKNPSAVYYYQPADTVLPFMKSVVRILLKYGIESKRLAALIDAFDN